MSNTLTNESDIPLLNPAENVVGQKLGIKELTSLLIAHNELHEGQFELLVEFMVGSGNMGPTPEAVAPATIVTVSKVGLVKVSSPSPMTVDAAIVNPKKKAKGKAAS